MSDPKAIDLEGLDDIEPIVIEAIRAGVMKRDDRNIHPRFEDTAENIAHKKAAIAAERAKDSSWLGKLREKLSAARQRDPNNYTLY